MEASKKDVKYRHKNVKAVVRRRPKANKILFLTKAVGSRSDMIQIHKVTKSRLSPSTDGIHSFLLEIWNLAQSYKVAWNAGPQVRKLGGPKGRKLGARKLGARKLGARKLGARKLGARKLGARKLGARRITTRNRFICLQSKWLGLTFLTNNFWLSASGEKWEPAVSIICF